MNEQQSLEQDWAAAAVVAIEYWPEWIHRRFETIDFVSLDSVRRAIRLDFSVPDILVQEEDWVYLPLAMVPKADVPSVEIVDETGAQTLALTSMESREAGGDILIASLGTGENIVDAPPADVTELLREIATSQRSEDAWRSLEAWNSACQKHRQEGRPWALASPRMERTQWLAAQLTDQELVFAILPADATPRRIFTLRYEESPPWHSGPSLLGISPLNYRLDRIAGSLGWTNLRAPVRLRGVAAASVDYVVEVPEGVVIRSVSLPVATERGVALREVASPEWGGERSMPIPLEEAGDDVTAFAFLRADPGYPLALAGASLFGAAVLLAGSFTLGRLNEATDASATLLLAGPTLFASLIAQPGRGELAAQTVRGARILLGLVALTAFLAAASLVALPQGDTQKSVWLALTAVAGLVTLGLGMGLLQRAVETLLFRRLAKQQAKEGGE